MRRLPPRPRPRPRDVDAFSFPFGRGLCETFARTWPAFSAVEISRGLAALADSSPESRPLRRTAGFIMQKLWASLAALAAIMVTTDPCHAFPADLAGTIEQVKNGVQTKVQTVQGKVQTVQNTATGLLGTLTSSLNADPEQSAQPVTKKMFDFVESFLVNVLRPQPIIDNIREEEKYGNDGEKFNKVGRSVVGGVESLTTFLASAADLPVNTLKSITRKASAALGSIGSKLVGLTK